MHLYLKLFLIYPILQIKIFNKYVFHLLSLVEDEEAEGEDEDRDVEDTRPLIRPGPARCRTWTTGPSPCPRTPPPSFWELTPACTRKPPAMEGSGCSSVAPATRGWRYGYESKKCFASAWKKKSFSRDVVDTESSSCLYARLRCCSFLGYIISRLLFA